MAQKLSYDALQTIILQCGSVHESRRFCTNALEQLDAAIPFDQGRVYFLNDSMSIFDEYLLGVDPSVTREYRERYSKSEGGRYSIPHRHQLNRGVPHCIDRTDQPQSDSFIREHLRPQNIQYRNLSAGFARDTRALFCLDRTTRINYTEEEIRTLDFLRTHLSNLYQNFFRRILRFITYAYVEIQENPLLGGSMRFCFCLWKVCPLNRFLKNFLSVRPLQSSIFRTFTKSFM